MTEIAPRMLTAKCGNPNCRDLVEYKAEGGCPPLSCNKPECKAVVEEDWAEVGDGFHFPQAHQRDIRPSQMFLPHISP